MKKEIIIVLILVGVIIYFGLTRFGSPEEQDADSGPAIQNRPTVERNTSRDRFLGRDRAQPEEARRSPETEAPDEPATAPFPPSMVRDDDRFPERVPPGLRIDQPPTADHRRRRPETPVQPPPPHMTPPDDMIEPGSEDAYASPEDPAELLPEEPVDAPPEDDLYLEETEGGLIEVGDEAPLPDDEGLPPDDEGLPPDEEPAEDGYAEDEYLQ